MLAVIFPLVAAGAESKLRDAPKKLVDQIATRWGCAADAMSFEHIERVRVFALDHDSWSVSGCGQAAMVTYVDTGHSGYIHDDRAVREKAPVDLACDAYQVTYSFVNESTRLVEGCGKRAAYAYTADGWVKAVVAKTE